MFCASRIHLTFTSYAAAIPASSGGFYAAVVVRTTAQSNCDGPELFRDERLEDGFVWRDPEEAIEFALAVGDAAVLAQQLVRQHCQEARLSTDTAALSSTDV
jgi:hypothetical protein